ELRAGTLQIEGLAVYEAGNISAQGRAQARQVSIHSPAIPSLLLDATTSYAWEKDQLNLTNLLVSVWGGTTQGTFQAKFGDSPVKFSLNTRIHHVQLVDALRSASAPPL